MPTFTTPLVRDRPPYLPDSTPAQVDLWRHFESRLRGVNVFKLYDGTNITYSQDTATHENSNTAIPYPYDPNDPSGPFVYIHNWDGTIQTISHEGGTGTMNDGQPYIVMVYYGGRSYTISTGEATLLTNYTAHGTGYGDRIT